MTRIRPAVPSHARKKRILKEARGYYGTRNSNWKAAKNAVEKAWSYAYEGRKQRKRQFRALWIQRINAAARSHGMSYARFLHGIKAEGITLNRKTLAQLAVEKPAIFSQMVERVAERAQPKA